MSQNHQRRDLLETSSTKTWSMFPRFSILILTFSWFTRRSILLMTNWHGNMRGSPSEDFLLSLYPPCHLPTVRSATHFLTPEIPSTLKNFKCTRALLQRRLLAQFIQNLLQDLGDAQVNCSLVLLLLLDRLCQDGWTLPPLHLVTQVSLLENNLRLSRP